MGANQIIIKRGSEIILQEGVYEQFAASLSPSNKSLLPYIYDYHIAHE